MNLPPMNWGLWWAQIRAVIRLEMKKTFFAKRGLWVYVLALLPLLLFIGHAIATSHEQERSARLARRFRTRGFRRRRLGSYRALARVRSGRNRRG